METVPAREVSRSDGGGQTRVRAGIDGLPVRSLAHACFYRGDGEHPWTRALGSLPTLPRLAAGAEAVHAAWSAGALYAAADGDDWALVRDDLPPARALLLL